MNSTEIQAALKSQADQIHTLDLKISEILRTNTELESHIFWQKERISYLEEHFRALDNVVTNLERQNTLQNGY